MPPIEIFLDMDNNPECEASMVVNNEEVIMECTTTGIVTENEDSSQQRSQMSQIKSVFFVSKIFYKWLSIMAHICIIFFLFIFVERDI